MQMSGRRFRSEQFTKLDTEADRLGYQTTQRRLALKRSLAALGLYPARVRTKSRIQCKVFYEHVLALCRLSLSGQEVFEDLLDRFENHPGILNAVRQLTGELKINPALWG